MFMMSVLRKMFFFLEFATEFLDAGVPKTMNYPNQRTQQGRAAFQQLKPVQAFGNHASGNVPRPHVSFSFQACPHAQAQFDP